MINILDNNAWKNIFFQEVKPLLFIQTKKEEYIHEKGYLYIIRFCDIIFIVQYYLLLYLLRRKNT